MKDSIIILGCGGHSRSVIEVIESTEKWDIIGLVGRQLDEGKYILDYKVIGSDSDLINLREFCPNAFIAIGEVGASSVRTKLTRLLSRLGYKLPRIIASTALISPNVKIADGVFIAHNVIINEGTEIGEGSIINTRSYIENHVKIGSYSHISTGVQIGSKVKVGKKSFIGSGSIIKEKEVIPQDSIISAGKLIINYKKGKSE